MKVPRCKGMRDLGPREMAQFRHIETEFRDCCSGWGYEEIRTPVVEYLHLFTSAGTLSPEMLGRVYSFLDWDGWSGERVVLRPDGTIPAARFYVENMERSEIARLFYVENVFAFEGTGEQPRERWQCGAELIGGSKPEGDVELLSLALEVLDRLGVGPVEVKVAHAGVIKAFLEGLGLSGEQEADVLDQVFSGNREALRQVDGANPEILRQLDMLFGLAGLRRESQGGLLRSCTRCYQEPGRAGQDSQSPHRSGICLPDRLHLGERVRVLHRHHLQLLLLRQTPGWWWQVRRAGTSGRRRGCLRVRLRTLCRGAHGPLR